ncbi:hypothetical protein PENTCL1PPCAC_21266, partial [Pristionchus entomophagus]
ASGDSTNRVAVKEEEIETEPVPISSAPASPMAPNSPDSGVHEEEPETQSDIKMSDISSERTEDDDWNRNSERESMAQVPKPYYDMHHPVT